MGWCSKPDYTWVRFNMQIIPLAAAVQVDIAAHADIYDCRAIE